ncbi:DNA polymerase III subunit alpha [Candidatus Babeliales bacterium]|nr:DNA polymerase III subunit alpha [Candidatus Babeliales bacterium]
MSKQFTHLHLHTEFSLLDGAIKLPDLLRRAKEESWSSIGISDHGNIFGAIKFFQLAKKEGIKPILGAEMYLTPDVKVKNIKEKYFHLLIIVQNRVGYQNLCRLMAFSYQEGFYFKPRIDYAALEKYSEGLIISTACLGGHIPSLLRKDRKEEAYERIEWGISTFGKDRFFLEVMPVDFEKQQVTNDALFEAAKKYDMSVIATGDAHYMNCKDREAHEVMLSIQTKDVLSNPNRYSFGEFKGHLKSTQDMLDAFVGHEEVVWNTQKIVDQVDFSFEFGKLHFPAYEIPKKHTQGSFFSELCLKGLQVLKDNSLIPLDLYSKYDDRLQVEIDLIIKMGYVGYFLVVSDFIMWAKKEGIPVGPGRGSAAGSLVAWSLEIIDIDPIKYGLMFERFLNPERVSMPDIDIDFCIHGRERVINYVREKYGSDCVCQIITFGTMMAKGVIKDVARVLGFPFQDANALTELIPDQLKISLDEAIEQEPRLKEMIDQNPKVHHLMQIAKRLEGLTRHASKHAAGVVISPEPLASVLPLYIPSRSNELVTQYAMTELESIGYLKMDFLGLKNLSIVDYVVKSLKKHQGIEIHLNKVQLDDEKTFKLLCAGNTAGVFQFESSGIQDVLRKLRPDKFEDLIAVNALYRPGPLGSGMVDDYIERRHGRKKTTYMFPELEPILSETYGVIVYQEQMMKIASVIAGYSLGGADILRRAMGKKKVEVMEEQRLLFIEGAINKKFNEKKSGKLFDLMAYFAGYGFNKSHSAAYALIAYQTAYLKANYPSEFMAGLLSFETGNSDQLTHYLGDAKQMGIKLLLSDINRSDIKFIADESSILFGLEGIKNVGNAALGNIMLERAKKPFRDLYDFCFRVDLRTVNKRVIESLIMAGAFDLMPGNRAQKIAELEQIMGESADEREAVRTGQMGLFGSVAALEDGEPKVYEFQPREEWSTMEKLEKEKEVAGFYLSAHPLESYASLARWFEIPPLSHEKARDLTEDVEIVCIAMISTIREITTKKGDKMAFAAIEDLHESAELIIFPKVYQKVQQLLADHTIFLIKGMLDAASDLKCKIKVNQLVPIDLIMKEGKGVIGVKFRLPLDNQDASIELLKKNLQSGQLRCMLVMEEHKKIVNLLLKQRVAWNPSAWLEFEEKGIEISCKL